MRTMYDSVNWAAIPTSATMVAGYVAPSGFTWPPQAWFRFSGALHVRITPSVVTTGRGVQVLDVERGDATPAQAPSWAHAQRALGQTPSVYCSASAWGIVQAAFTGAGEPQPLYWVAAYPGTGLSLPTLNGITAVAHQYADPATSGGDWDLSVVADHWPGVDPGGMMSDFDTVVTMTTADGETISISYGWMLQNIYGMIFYGSRYAPWAGPSMVQQLLNLVGTTDAVEQTLQPGVVGQHPAGAVFAELAQVDADVQAVRQLVSADQATLLAAIQAIPPASVDPTRVAAALDAAGLPQQLVSAFVAVLAKATGA